MGTTETSTTFKLNTPKWDGVTTMLKPNNNFRLTLQTRYSNKLNNLDTDNNQLKFQPYKKPKLCVIFTCLGTHYPGMGRKIYNSSSIFRLHFDYCDQLLQNNYGISVIKFLKDESIDPAWVKCSMSHLPYMLSLEYSLFKLLEICGIKPNFVLGHSFGEYAGAAFAGIISIQDAFKLVLTGTSLITKNMKEEAVCVTETDQDTALLLIKQNKMNLDICAINSPNRTYIVGKKECILTFSEICKNNKIKSYVYAPYYPYHSRLMQQILPEFEKTTRSIVYEKPCNSPKLISSITGELKSTLDKDYFLSYLTQSVHFINAIETAVKEGVTIFLEIGPNPTHIPMVRSIVEKYTTSSYPETFSYIPTLKYLEDDVTTIWNGIVQLCDSGCEIDWNGAEAAFQF